VKKPGIAAAILVILSVGAFSAAAMSHGDAKVRIYWTGSGLLGPFSILDVLPTYPKDQDRQVMMPVVMFIIDHPKGLVVFDTGNNVVISDGNCKSHWNSWICDALQPSQTREEVIDRQLEKVGYSVGDVKIVITSHSHLDHIGNIEMFPDAIHVIQKKELYQAWWPEKFQRGGAHVMADYDDARDFTYFELNGDYDLFGDGSVVIISTPGHTLGHQSVKVRLNDTGTVILAQDAVWIKENLEGHPAGLNYSILDYTNSVNRIKMIRDIENAQIWMGHSIDQYTEMGEKWYQ
jgi:glyoxylase-like metal-dependent hydrolase (beta-lactamase superfamily II)